MVGITRYSHELLSRLVHSPHQWFLYFHQPPLHSLPELSNVHIRYADTVLRGFGTVYAQTVFAGWARRDRVDVFWSPRHHLPLILSPRIKTLLTVHDLVWKNYPETMAPMGRLLESFLMPRSIAKAHKVITVSQAIADELVEHFPNCSDELEVIYSGLTMSPGLGGKIIDDPYFLFVGTREPRKNLPRLIKAFQRFSRLNDSCKLILAGAAGWGGQPLHQMINSCGLSGRVLLTNRVSDAELAEYYSGCLALVMPSLYEGFGLPLIEAMGHGAPVITTNYGACREVAGEAGILVDPGSEQSICDAMLALTNKQLQETLSMIAIRRAQQFNWNTAAGHVRAAIESLV